MLLMSKFERFVLIICIGSITIVNSLHVLTEYLANPPDRLFTAIAHYWTDYFLYISQMAQGSLLSRHMFTNEPLPPTWIYWFNGLIGALGTRGGLSVFATYNISLIGLVALLGFCWYRLCLKLYPSSPMRRLVCLLFLLTASNFFTLFHGSFGLMGDVWFSPTPALNRLGGVPHQVFQTILLMMVILLFHSTHRSKLVLLCVVTFLASIANPVQMILVIAALAWTKNWQTLVPTAIIAATGAILANRKFSLQPILSVAKQWELAQYVSINPWELFVSFGPVGLLCLIGLVTIRRKQASLKTSFVLYGILSLILFLLPIGHLVGISPVRWLHPAAYAGILIIAVDGFFLVGKKVPVGILIALYLMLTIPSLWVQTTSRTSPENLNHLPLSVARALAFLKSQKEDFVVITDPQLPYDVIVPALTKKRSFTGHLIHTLYPDVKERLRNEFFWGQMDDHSALQFLKDHDIGYVFSMQIPRYSFLKTVYSQHNIIIAAVQ